MDTTKEFDPMKLEFDPTQLGFTVTPELNRGYGRISAANRMNDEEAQEAAVEARAYIESVSDGAPCGCIDGRCVLHALNGEASELGPKTAGGAAVSTLLGMELDASFPDTSSVYSDFAHVITTLEDDGKLPVRFHIDADHEAKVKDIILQFRKELSDVVELEDFLAKVAEAELKISGSGCGMNDQLVGATSRVADTPGRYMGIDGIERSETAEEVADRLTFLKATGAAVQGSSFNEELFDIQARRATVLRDGKFKDWDSLKALLVADRVLGSRGVKDGVMSRLEVLETSNKGVHGHVEDLALFILRLGTTFNQSKYYQETGKQAFTYDVWVSDLIAHAGAASLADTTARYEGIRQAVTIVNLGGAYQLIDGTQRAVIYR